METYEVQSDGHSYTFNVIKNTTEPCPQCGVPACGREDIIWYEFNGERWAIVFDGGFFDMALDECVGIHIGERAYETLPTFLREWNEARGWTDCWDYDGWELEFDDFMQSLTLLRSCKMGDSIIKEEIDGLEKLAQAANEKQVKLKITRG